MDANSLVRGLAAIGAGIAVCAGLGTGIGEGICASKAVEALYGLLIAILLIVFGVM